jgi:hypothetical protein
LERAVEVADTGSLGIRLVDEYDPFAGWCAGDSARAAHALAAERTTPVRGWAEAVLERAVEVADTGPPGIGVVDESEPSAGWCASDSERSTDVPGVERTTPACAWAEAVLNWAVEVADIGPVGIGVVDESELSAGWCASDSERPADAPGVERTTPAHAWAEDVLERAVEAAYTGPLDTGLVDGSDPSAE